MPVELEISLKKEGNDVAAEAMNDSHSFIVCPLRDVHRRLQDAAKMWKNASKSYFSPDEFRVAVQPCIQALRSVTWVLQNNKAKLRDFDDWYVAWQKRMRENAVLRWIVDARNRIEKQGDLQTRSILRVTLSRSWHDEPSMELQLPPIMTTEQIADLAVAQVPDREDEEALLRIERHWVDSELPDHELLDALVKGYSFLHELIGEAHQHLTPPFNLHDCEANSSEVQMLSEHMTDASNPRTIWIKLKDREHAVVTPHFQRTSEEELTAAGERYGKDESVIQNLREAKTFQEECAAWFAMAKQILRTDKYHLPTALLKTEKKMHIVNLKMDDRAEKHIALRHLAQQAARLGAQSVFFINEVWLRPATKVSETHYAVDNNERLEALALHGLSKEGMFVTRTAQFQRTHDDIVFRPDHVNSETFPNILLPFCEIWNIRRTKP